MNFYGKILPYKECTGLLVIGWIGTNTDILHFEILSLLEQMNERDLRSHRLFSNSIFIRIGNT